MPEPPLGERERLPVPLRQPPHMFTLLEVEDATENKTTASFLLLITESLELLLCSFSV